MPTRTPSEGPAVAPETIGTSKELCAVLYSHDVALRTRLESILMQFGYSTDSCHSLDALRRRLSHTDRIDCLVLGAWHFQTNEQDWLHQAAATGGNFAVLFVGGEGDAREALQAMEQGHARFVSEDATDRDIHTAIHTAVVQIQEQRSDELWRQAANVRLARLTAREREVCSLLARGMLNKQVAAEIGISEKTVKFYRARLHAKLDVRSLAELVRLVDRATPAKKT